jgi:hypothetical protein
MSGIITNLAGDSVGVPSAPASLTNTVVNSTTVNLTYGAIQTNGEFLIPLQGSGTNTGDIIDILGTAVPITYSGTLSPAGGTITVTGSFAANTTYEFSLRAQTAAGPGPYVSTTTGIVPNFSFVPFSFTPFGFTPYGFGGGWSNSLNIKTKVQTLNGLKSSEQLKVGDKLLALKIDSENLLKIDFNNIDPKKYFVETIVDSINVGPSDKYIYIDGDVFTPSHYILCKKEDLISFIKASEVNDTYQIYSYKFNRFIDIQLVEEIKSTFDNVAITCKPYNNFFTENMLVLGSKKNI